MTALILAALLGQAYLGDVDAGGGSVYASEYCTPSGCVSALGNGVPNPLVANLTVEGTVVGDAGYVGGTQYADHFDSIAGAPAPTCGFYTNTTNTFDGGVSCINSSTDMAGTLSVTATAHTTSVIANTPMLYVVPGTAYSAKTRCIVRPSNSAAASATPSADLYTYIDGGAGIQLLWSAAQTTSSAVYTWDWVCL